jgi:hypothetical protein
LKSSSVGSAILSSGRFVVVSLGGVLVDAIDDVALTPAPLEDGDARRLLH